MASFTNVSTNTGVVWSNANITVGTLNFSNPSGNVVIGDNTITNDTLTLATSTGKPTLNVASNNGTAFIYATLLGTNGFTKTGGGNLTFRFNATDMSYTGDINLNAGTLTINQDGNLGDANNDIIVGGNSTLSYSPGSNTGGGSLSAGRSITISNGTTLNLQTLNTNTPFTINGVISDAGALTFLGASTGSNAASSLSYRLNGANTYTGQTTIQGGARVTLGNGASLGNGTLSLSGGVSTNTAFTLDLGGNTQNVASLTVGSSSAYVRNLSIGNGILNVTNAAGVFSLNGTNGTLLDMSNLTTFTWRGGSTLRNFTIQPDTSASASVANTNTVYFARSSNQITGLTFTIGGASGASQGLDHAARVFLGTNNVINASSLNIGGFNGMGSVNFMDNINDGTVVVRGTNGTDALPLLVVGNTSSGSRRGSGALNLGLADARVTDTIIGNFQANAVTNLTVTNSITMAGGSFASINLYVGAMTNPAGTGNVLTNISTFQQNGGTSSVALLRMGDNRATDAGNTIAFQSSYNLVGSNTVLRAQTIDAGTNSIYGANALRTLTISNNATLRNANDVDLSVNGFTNTAAGRITINLAGNGRVEADSNRTVTLGANTLISGAGALTKNGDGTLVLQASNSYSGGTTVNAGTLTLGGSGTLGATNGALSIVAGTVNLGGLTSRNGAFTLHNGTLSNGTLIATSYSLTSAGSIGAVLAGPGALTKTGVGTTVLTASNTYNGATSVNAGRLEVASGGSIALSATTVNSGATLDVDGTAGNVQLNDGGTLSGSGTVSALTIASGGTLSPGNSPGTLTASSATWSGGGTYVWEINNFLGGQGSAYDFLNVTGTLTIDAASGNEFLIDIVSLLGAGPDPDLAANFDLYQNYSFAIATAGGITYADGLGFSASRFLLDVSGFLNNMSDANTTTGGVGFWGVTQAGNSIMLNYTAATAIPEPGTGGFLVMGLGLVAAMRRHLRS